MLRRTHVHQLISDAVLSADYTSDPLDVGGRTGYSIIAGWSEASGAAKTFVSGVAEETDVICIADAGERESSEITCVADVAGSLNNTYFLIESINAVTKAVKMHYVWFNVNAAGVDPAVSGATGVEVAIATGATSPTVGTAVKNALNALTNDFAASNIDEVVTVTNVRVGNVAGVVDGAIGTGFTFSVTVPGVDSNLNNRYFTINNALDANPQFAWFNVDGLGTAPVIPGKTGVAVAITYGAQADTDVAAALDAAVFTGIGSSAGGATVTFTNAATGAATDADDDGGTGFTITVTTQGVTTTINQTTERVTVTAHGFVTGQKLTATTTSALPTGIPSTAYAIVVDENTLKFATSKANALAGTNVNITSDGTGTHTLTRAAIDGSVKLQASNDYNPDLKPVAAGTWSDITGSTAAMSGVTTYGWNVADCYYKWVRVVYTWAAGDGTMNATVCVKD